MKQYPDNIKFKYNWRKYQQKVLDSLTKHLADRHLHIIAPPGSGKTVLGLEVAIQINQPTLILAPTLAIRNQWIQRFCELFLQTHLSPDWISVDIRNPKLMTVVTYQGLHAACNYLEIGGEEENMHDESEEEIDTPSTPKTLNLETIVKGLVSQSIKTIIVDEAHHLKNEWWQTLSKVKQSLDPIIVGLTATPPYDVTPNEWQRYINLNGPVDIEITVPELILEGDLCPHQDYVYFTLPTEKENQGILAFRQNTEKLFQEIRQDPALVQAIEKHPIWQNPHQNLEWIYNHLAYYSACLIFLHANQREIPTTHLEVIGDKNLEIPSLSYEWLATLLDFYLYKENTHFSDFEAHQKTLENQLRRYGVIERRQIDFSYNKRITNFLTSSVSKLNGIKEIVDFEYQQLGSALRLVVLSDFIRKEFFINAPENNLELNKIGVMPIFEKLRRTNKNHKKIGVLSGAIIIIPASAYPTFEAKAKQQGITQISTSPLPYDSNYLLIHQNESIKYAIVHIITQVFQQGEIEVLIGTKSLLGEGWDAPAINALILASFVGSFVLSNQMRGRAIRTQTHNPTKTSNIWHLACADFTSPATGGDDFELLKRRFKTFVGLSFGEEANIENGIGRLNLPQQIQQASTVHQKNTEMFAEAAKRESLKKRWEMALATGVNLVEEIKIPFPKKQSYQSIKSLYFKKTISNLLATLGTSMLTFAQNSFRILDNLADYMSSVDELYYALGVVGITAVAFFGRRTYKAGQIYLKYRDISKDIAQIAHILLNTLRKAGYIHTSPDALRVETSVDTQGAVFCHLEGGSTLEKSTFINALQEIITPINNPRYVIIRKSTSVILTEQKDYHAVPELLGKNRSLAEYFKNQWVKHVGACDLMFTRSLEGRKILLQARIESLSARLDGKVARINKWT